MPTHPVRLWVVEEVGPVRVRLHEPELKQLPEAQHQDVLTDLRQKHREILFFILMTYFLFGCLNTWQFIHWNAFSVCLCSFFNPKTPSSAGKAAATAASALIFSETDLIARLHLTSLPSKVLMEDRSHFLLKKQHKELSFC